MTTTARQQTFATMTIAGLFGAAITCGFLQRDTQSVPETTAARHRLVNISAAGPKAVVAPSRARTELVGPEPATGEPGLPEFRTAHHDAAGGSPDESEEFQVRVPRRFLSSTVSAAVGVPVLVNE